ncbi:MAG: thiopurine S-methyltransferase [Pontibacterium sp.]
MEHAFWHARWTEGRIGFHQSDVNSKLLSYWPQLELTGTEPVFVPLCGKSGDMLWLREQGHPVLGVELNDSACRAFFAENEGVPQTESRGRYQYLSMDGIGLLCGDVFALTAGDLAQVGAVYDRAALVALPPEMRADYARLLCECLPAGVSILLVVVEFEGEQGPPFAVFQPEIEALFGGRFEIRSLMQPDPMVKRQDRAYLLLDKAEVTGKAK